MFDYFQKKSYLKGIWEMRLFAFLLNIKLEPENGYVSLA